MAALLGLGARRAPARGFVAVRRACAVAAMMVCGTSEQLAKDLSDVQRRQKDIVQGVDDRLKKVEPQQVNLDGKTFSADP